MHLADTLLFRKMAAADVEAMLPCLGTATRRYQRDERVLRAGEIATRIGVLLEGRLRIEAVDSWGRITILETVSPGEPFAVAYALGGNSVLDVDVVAEVASTVATLEAERIMHPCAKQCECHVALVRNMLVSLANKNVAMNRRAMAIAPKTVRGKILAYLSLQQKIQGSSAFAIPFTQERLAAYLGIDRSTLSAELSALRKEGVIAYRGKHFELL